MLTDENEEKLLSNFIIDVSRVLQSEASKSNTTNVL